MTVHPLRTSGTVIAAPQTYRYFERLQERIVSFVAGHSGISVQAFQDLMFRAEDMAADVGTILYGEEAVSCGLIDQLGGLPESLDYLYAEIARRKGKTP